MSKIANRNLLPTLYVVATPIGNLNDLSPRAIEVLTRVPLIYCEDTRRTQQLLNNLQKSKKTSLKRMDTHREHSSKLAQLLERDFSTHTEIALVSDAGSPVVSDPGSEVVAWAHENHVRVVPIPGPSAVTALLSVSGFPEAQWSFQGFFPRENAEFEDLTERVKFLRKGGVRVCIFFESPRRLEATLDRIQDQWPDTRGAFAKEFTKVHEKIWVGEIGEISNALKLHLHSEGAVGEWCFALLFPETISVENSDWEKALECLLESQISVKDAASRVCHKFGVAKNRVYSRALQLSNKK